VRITINEPHPWCDGRYTYPATLNQAEDWLRNKIKEGKIVELIEK